MSIWRLTRLVVIAASAASALFMPASQPGGHLISWYAVLFIALFFPAILFLAAVVMTMIRGPKLDVHQPDWDHNLLDFSHAEHFFHLGAIAIAASGFITAFRSLIDFGQIEPIQVVPMAFSIGIWAGVHAMARMSRRQSQNAT